MGVNGEGNPVIVRKHALVLAVARRGERQRCRWQPEVRTSIGSAWLRRRGVPSLRRLLRTVRNAERLRHLTHAGAKASARILPMPLVVPVTRATFPSKENPRARRS